MKKLGEMHFGCGLPPPLLSCLDFIPTVVLASYTDLGQVFYLTDICMTLRSVPFDLYSVILVTWDCLL